MVFLRAKSEPRPIICSIPARKWLQNTFSEMQRGRFANRKAPHASMTVGDVVAIEDQVYMAGFDGFYAPWTAEMNRNDKILKEAY